MKKIALALFLLATTAFAADDAPKPLANATGTPTPITPKAPEKQKNPCGKDADECQKAVNEIAAQARKWQAASARYRSLLQGLGDKVAQDAIDATN